MTYYDDNFGFWDDMDDEDMREFYKQVQEESVEKECVICGCRVRLRPEYDKCNSCMEQMERMGGW